MKTIKFLMSKPYLKINLQILLLILFYTVGVFGIIIPQTRQLILVFTPALLLITSILLFLNHTSWNLRNIIVFTLIYVSGFAIEWIGTNTGWPFGIYNYGQILGPTIGNTPILIGINWLVLTYCSNSITNLFKVNKIFKIIISSGFMVLFDLVMETVAISTGMWTWNAKTPPLENFISWFVISMIFQSIIEYLKIQTTNQIAKSIFIIQWLFFSILSIYFTTVHD